LELALEVRLADPSGLPEPDSRLIQRERQRPPERHRPFGL